jgi:hypothetical protein
MPAAVAPILPSSGGLHSGVYYLLPLLLAALLLAPGCVSRKVSSDRWREHDCTLLHHLALRGTTTTDTRWCNTWRSLVLNGGGGGGGAAALARCHPPIALKNDNKRGVFKSKQEQKAGANRCTEPGQGTRERLKLCIDGGQAANTTGTCSNPRPREGGALQKRTCTRILDMCFGVWG